MKQLVINHKNRFSYNFLMVVVLVKWLETAGAVFGEKHNFTFLSLCPGNVQLAGWQKIKSFLFWELVLASDALE
jgi:hypothetical protein